MNIHIYAPQPDLVKEIRVYCSTCNKETDFLLEYTEWIGIEVTCLICGDSWTDEGRSPRPFYRGWRATRVHLALHRLQEYNVAQHKRLRERPGAEKK